MGNSESNNHPDNFRGLNPKEFAKEFGNTNYFYQRECFKELAEEYYNQSYEDKKRNRLQLCSGLENLSTALYLITKSFNKVCNSCRNYIRNPYKG